MYVHVCTLQAHSVVVETVQIVLIFSCASPEYGCDLPRIAIFEQGQLMQARLRKPGGACRVPSGPGCNIAPDSILVVDWGPVVGVLDFQESGSVREAQPVPISERFTLYGYGPGILDSSKTRCSVK